MPEPDPITLVITESSYAPLEREIRPGEKKSAGSHVIAEDTI